MFGQKKIKTFTMDKLTTQEIAKVFAMYLPCNIKGLESKLVAINFEDQQYMILENEGYNDRTVPFESPIKLLLTPLSNITNEHRLTIAKMMEFDIISFGDNVFTVNVTVTKYPFKKELDIECIHYIAADQLREWGYALPYKGQSLFELGIAIESPKN